MKKFVIDGIMKYIKNSKQYTDIELETIRYGISNLYLQITKTIVISLIAIALNVFIPYLIFTCLYNILRLPSFGVHAKKSWHCWVSSIIFFIGTPYLIKVVHIDKIIMYIIIIIAILYITYYSPADTVKHPIISPKRRKTYKICSFILSVIYAILCLIIRDKIVSYAFLFSLILQCIIVSPATYKIFGQPYNNYKNYL